MAFSAAARSSVGAGRDDPRHPLALVGAGLLVLAVLAVTLVGGWPYWSTHGGAAATVITCNGLLAALGAVLLLSRPSIKSGVYLVSAALMYGLSWVSSYNAGIMPMIGEGAVGIFFLLLGLGILYDGQPALPTRWATAWAVGAGFFLGPGNVIYWLTTRPADIGYDGESVWWLPHLDVSAITVDLVLAATAWSYGLVAITFALVLYLNSRAKHWLDRRISYPVFVLGGVCAVGAAIVQYPSMQSGVSLDQVLLSRTYQGVVAIFVPVAYFGSAIRAQWESRGAVAWVSRAIGTGTAESVQQALRDFMQDEQLRIWVWLPRAGVYVDAAGHVQRRPSEPEPAEDSLWLLDGTGSPLALCHLGVVTPRNAAIVRSVFEACAPALFAAQLQWEATERVRAQQRRLFDAELRGRESLARDLHDGVQQDLAAIRIDLNRLTRMTSLDGVHQGVDEASERIQFVIEQLRAITRGLHPPALVERGLAGALEDDIERLETRVSLQVTREHMDPGIQLVLYYVISEAITNATKHAKSRTISVRVWKAAHTYLAEVTDDGTGGAELVLGGGLYNARDRVRSLRGSLDLLSPVGAGTIVRVTLPADEDET